MHTGILKGDLTLTAEGGSIDEGDFGGAGGGGRIVGIFYLWPLNHTYDLSSNSSLIINVTSGNSSMNNGTSWFLNATSGSNHRLSRFLTDCFGFGQLDTPRHVLGDLKALHVGSASRDSRKRFQELGNAPSVGQSQTMRFP